MSEETKKLIERFLTVAITAAMAGGGTYVMKQGQLDRIEATMLKLVTITDVCQRHVYTREGPESALWGEQTDAVEEADANAQEGQ